MPGALLDAQRIVTPYRAPRDAGRAQVVERHVPAVCVAVEELGPGHLGGLKMLAEKDRPIFVVRHPQHMLRARVDALGSEARGRTRAAG